MATWLITGANRGIGLGLATQLLARGERVIAACRDPGKAEALSGLKAAHGETLTILPLEVTSAQSVAAAAAAVREPLAVLINNAGIYGPRSGQDALDMDFQAWAQVLAVNTLAPLRVAQAFLPHLENARGKLLTITSPDGLVRGRRMRAPSPTARPRRRVNKAMLGFAEAVRPRGVAVAAGASGLGAGPTWAGRAQPSPCPESAAGSSAWLTGCPWREAGQFRNYDGSPISW